jgi:murein DD-endopeptidase MepM/ murein hydrolase activator NlpD
VHAANPYEDSDEQQAKSFKLISLPLQAGTEFLLSQGAFGRNTHHDPGEEYKWDFDVPFDTPVLAVENGTVLSVWEPDAGGGCDPKFSESPHNIKIEHGDGTVAQYVHVNGRVKPGDRVRRGDVIAVTALNGFICSPQLCFSVYKSRDHLHGTPSPQTIQLAYRGIEGGLLREGNAYRVPK